MKQIILCLFVLTLSLSVTRSAETISLAGIWRFEIAGTNASAYAERLPGNARMDRTDPYKLIRRYPFGGIR
jgi:hypothetical protein